MTFTNAIVVCFQKYVEFTGRATRSEFWLFTLFVTLLTLCAEFFDPYIRGIDVVNVYSYGPFALTALVITALPSTAVAARRLHDIGYSGWWQLIAFTGIGLVPLLYLWCRPSDSVANGHGSSPVQALGDGTIAAAPSFIRFIVFPFVIVVTGWFMYFSFVVMDGEEMGVRVYSGSELSEEHLSLLAKAELITDDQIQYFYSDELGTVAESGQFVTLERVVSFVTDSNGNLNVSQMLLNQIDRVEEIRSPGDFTDGEYRVFGNDDADYDFITLALPTDEYGKQRFIDALGVAD